MHAMLFSSLMNLGPKYSATVEDRLAQGSESAWSVHEYFSTGRMNRRTARNDRCHCVILHTAGAHLMTNMF